MFKKIEIRRCHGGLSWRIGARRSEQINAAENVIGVNWWPCSRISPRVTKRDDLKPDVSPTCGPFPHQWIVTVSFSLSYVGFLKNLFVVSTKFLADDDVVVEATESDAAVSWIADVSMVRQLGNFFALMDDRSLFVDFD